MAESTRMVSDKIGVENLYVCQPNATIYYLADLVKKSSQSSQWSSTAYELGNGMPTELLFFNKLSCNTFDLSLMPKIFAHRLSFNSTPGIMVHLTNS